VKEDDLKGSDPPRSTPISSEEIGEPLLDLVVEGSDPLVLLVRVSFTLLAFIVLVPFAVVTADKF
jgi:hypothetical protein